MTLSLPYFEQQQVAQMIDYNLPLPDYWEVNAPVFRQRISVYQCPSDNTGIEGSYDQTLNNGPGYTRSNVVGCFSADGTFIEPDVPYAGIGYPNNQDPPNPSVTSGKRAFFNAHVVRSFADLTDGASHTAAVSEQIAGPDGSRDLRGTWWGGWGIHYTHQYGPNSPVPDSMSGGDYCDPANVPCENSASVWLTINFSARSYHPGGVNVGMVDGSVHFIEDQIDHYVWQALGSINGDEPIPAEF